MTLPPFEPGPTAMPPKLPLAVGLDCCAPDGPHAPSPVTGAPLATIFPLTFQSTHRLPLPTAMDGWSTLPVPTDTGAPNVTPPSVLKVTSIWFTDELMYTRNRLPNLSKTAWPSQQATPVTTVPRVQLAPPFIEYARKMLLLVRLEKATMLFGFVGLTTTKVSDSLPLVWLALTTEAVQASGW